MTVKYPILPSAEKVALQFQLTQGRSYSSTEFPVSSANASTSHLAFGLTQRPQAAIPLPGIV
jgi:hypothetical protein